jgi:hypothetical protein
MAKFQLASNNIFKRAVEIFFADTSQGELDVEFEKVSQDELMELLNDGGDTALLKRVLKSTADIPVEGSDKVLKGADAVNAVLADPACVAGLAADYMSALKGGSFRARGTRKGR